MEIQNTFKFKEHKGRFSCQYVSTLLRQGERTVQSLQAARSFVSLLRLLTKMPVSTSCSTDTCSRDSGWRPKTISNRSLGSHLPLVICSHYRPVLDLIQSRPVEDSFSSYQATAFSTRGKILKQVLRSHFTLLSLACCQELKRAVTFTVSGVPIWHGAREGEKYV